MNMLRDHTSSQRYTINFRGGGDRVRFFVSGAYYTQDGVYKEKKMPTMTPISASSVITYAPILISS